MKFTRLALLILASAASLARAQDEERRAPPIEIPDFSNLDEYIYEPKSAVKLSFRYLAGAKAQFFSTGVSTIPSPVDLAPATGTNIQRNYHDGFVGADTRNTVRVDTSGNPIVDPSAGSAEGDPIPNDGKTNSWGYADLRQLDSAHAPLGYISFHRYSASIVDTAIRNASTNSTAGLDLAVNRDMGKLLGTGISWSIVAGMSVNDINGRKTDSLLARHERITDLYSLYGVTPPEPPFESGTGSTTSQEVLIGNEPTRLPTEIVENSDQVQAQWKVKGAYYTFRGGAELSYPFTSRLRASVSAGAAVVYAGTSYTVTQINAPELGAEVTTSETDSVYKLRPGYFADASLQFDLTDKTGFFAGAVFQSASSYTQRLNTDVSQYGTKIDLSNQTGIKAGMSIRF